MPVHLVVIGGRPPALSAEHPSLARVERGESAPRAKLSWVPGTAEAERVIDEARAARELVVLADGGAGVGAALAGAGVLWAGSIAGLEALVAGLAGVAQPAPAGGHFAHLGLILAGVVHDLRSPLSFMVSRAELGHELVAELGPSAPAAEFGAIAASFAHIERHGRAAIELVHSVLEIAKGTAVGTVRVALDDELRHLVALFQPSEGIELELSLDAGPAEIEIGARDLSRIVLNLIHNAQQALLRGGDDDARRPRRITISTRLEAGEVELGVADNGAGIPVEARERIFEPSYSTTGGTGLGLAVVKRLVETHGASIALESGDCAGARFVLRFPRCVLQPRR